MTRSRISVTVILLILAVTIVCPAQGTLVLYDDTHGQTAGNADWVIDGAYSEVVDDLKKEGFIVKNLSAVAPNGQFTPDILKEYAAVILAEPNNPYRAPEQKALVEFVKNGGGAFLISDHGGADRDNDGYDAVKALNEFCPQFGFSFRGDTFYEAPLAGKAAADHPVMFGVRGVGAWAGSSIDIATGTTYRPVGLQESRYTKAPYIMASEVEAGRVVAIGDSSPFDDGTGSGGKNKLHDSYDSFMYSHPQLAYNALVWITGGTPAKRIPSRTVAMFNEASLDTKARNILIDAAHGNPAADKMQTYERHMKKLGFHVYYTLNLLTPAMLERFSIVILSDPSMRYLDQEAQAVSDWFLKGGRLFISGNWDSARLSSRQSLNFLLTKIGSVIRLNDDQVQDKTNKTNKPWGVVCHVFKPNHPVTAGLKQVITWGTCSLVTRDLKPLTEAAGVDILMTGDDDTFNLDRKGKKPGAVIYPKNIPIALMAVEKLANGIVAVSGCCNFTDYQYPDSDINQAQGGESPVVHETPEYIDNLMTFLAAPPVAGARRR